MAVVGIVLHHEREHAAELANDAVSWLGERGHEVRLPRRDAGIAGLGEFGADEATFARGLDLALSLGGDGTMLRTVELVAGEGVPVVGVNVGQLGYLTEVEPTGMRMALKRFLAGSYEVEERMLVQVGVDAATARRATDPDPGVAEESDRPDRIASTSVLALNEAVLEKTPMGHTVRLGVSIDGRFFTSYVADGLILATHVNAGGKTSGFTVPNPNAQAELKKTRGIEMMGHAPIYPIYEV